MARNFVELTALLVAVVLIGSIFAQSQDAREDEYPFLVSLRLESSIWRNCAGVMVIPNEVVTAAACIEGELLHPFSRIGLIRANISGQEGGQVYAASNVQVHPGYVINPQGLRENNVAVITLRDPITFNSSQQPIALATEDPPAGTRVTLIQRGLLGNIGLEPATLQVFAVDAMTNEDCQAQLGLPIPSTLLCTRVPAGQNSCQYESGSPLVYQGELVGIVSGGFPCGFGMPVLSSRVSAFRSFVDDAVAG